MYSLITNSDVIGVVDKRGSACEMEIASSHFCFFLITRTIATRLVTLLEECIVNCTGFDKINGLGAQRQKLLFLQQRLDKIWLEEL
jgi:hypothetical protein